MLPRSHVFSNNEGISDHLLQQILTHGLSQQPRTVAHRNFANFHGPSMNRPCFIPTSERTPVQQPIVACNPNRAMGTRKRQRHNTGQNEQKRQRFSSPAPQHRNVTNAILSSPTPSLTSPMRSHGAQRSCAPVYSPAISKPGGFVTSLREASHENAFPSSSAKDKLSQQILDLFNACEQRDDDLMKKDQCRAALQRDIQTIFPCAKVLLAGSSLNGFSSRSSDADLCLVIKGGTVNPKSDAVNVLTRVRKLLFRLSYIERPLLIRAKVPILKFRDRVSGVEFDLNFNNTIGIRNTFLLRTYAYVEKRVRPIILVLKKWASHHRINDASQGTLSSYTLVLMVLHYLQTLPEPVIPCLQRDYPECFDLKMDIDDVPTGPSNIPPFVSKNHSSLGDLVLGFLRYYGMVFKWDKYVISVREAKALPKTSRQDWNKFICVEEPFDRTNTARAVNEKKKFEAIKATLSESYQILLHRKDLTFILPPKSSKSNR